MPEVTIHSVSQCVAEFFPAIVEKKKKLKAIFSTYNSVNDYPDGPVSDLPKGLSIGVAAGGLVPSIERLMAFDDARASGDRIAMRRENQAYHNEAVSKIESEKKKLRARTRKAAPDLFVIYAGLRGFGSTIRLVQEFKKTFPRCIVVMVACDCDNHAKEERFVELLQDGTISAAVMDYRCGGREILRELLAGLVQAWRRRSSW